MLVIEIFRLTNISESLVDGIQLTLSVPVQILVLFVLLQVVSNLDFLSVGGHSISVEFRCNVLGFSHPGNHFRVLSRSEGMTIK